MYTLFQKNKRCSMNNTESFPLFYTKQVIYLFAIGYAIYCNSYVENKKSNKKIKE